MKKNRQILAIAGTVTLLCSLLAGCGQGAQSEGSTGTESIANPQVETQTKPEAGDKTLKLYVAGFQNLDPQIWSWGSHVDRMGIFEGLTLLNPDFTARMGNAESITHNEDSTVWTVKLRSDLKWSDGTPLNADDYMYSFRRIIDPVNLQGKSTAFNTNAPIKNALNCQKGEVPFEEVGIKKMDERTIEFTLETSCANFDVRLAESWGLPVPKHAIEKYGDEWTRPENIVVNGPYIPVSREEDVHLVLKPNQGYYEVPSLEQIDIYAGAQNQLLAYKNGDINVATIKAADIDVVNADAKLAANLQKFDTSVVTYLGMLKGKNNILQKHPQIRQAISLSIDREMIANAVNKGTVAPAYSLVYPGFAEWAKDLDVIEYNVEKAQQLMAQAGYPNGEGLPEMTCLVAGTPGADVLAVADMIHRGTGIRVKIVNQEWAAFVQDRDAFHEDDTWGIFLDGWNTSVADVSGAFANYQFDIRVGNLEPDALKAYAAANRVVADEEAARKTCKNENANRYAEKYEQLLITNDAAQKEAGYKELEIMRLEDCTNIPLTWSKSLLLIQPSIQGYEGNPMLLNSPPFYFKDITNN